VLLVAHLLGPDSPELARANSEIGGALDILRATGCDASVTTQASPYNQSVAFPSTPLFRDGQSRWRREPGNIPQRSGIVGDF